MNCDVDSENFGNWQSFVLSDKNRLQVIVPPSSVDGHRKAPMTAVCVDESIFVHDCVIWRAWANKGDFGIQQGFHTSSPMMSI